jgi:putative ABC transport system substrate-binding protein
VDILMTFGSLATAAAKPATSSVPIVVLGVVDPVGQGLVSNLAHPEANLTAPTRGASLASKQVELLRDMVPGVSRIAFLWNPESPGNEGNAREHHAAAPAPRLELHDVPVRTPEEIAAALETIRSIGPQALRLLSEEVFNAHKPEWLGFAAHQHPIRPERQSWVLSS